MESRYDNNMYSLYLDTPDYSVVTTACSASCLANPKLCLMSYLRSSKPDFRSTVRQLVCFLAARRRIYLLAEGCSTHHSVWFYAAQAAVTFRLMLQKPFVNRRSIAAPHNPVFPATKQGSIAVFRVGLTFFQQDFKSLLVVAWQA